jgi:hypothetical protein
VNARRAELEIVHARMMLTLELLAVDAFDDGSDALCEALQLLESELP